ncbi:copper resistance protein CopC [Paenibacillus sp. MMO-177]|uniref:copper resistance protein CopC n=1 Tax=Paenibacillus sp. MMO-177 TaxID=3081289 RepID=UPI00301903F1
MIKKMLIAFLLAAALIPVSTIDAHSQIVKRSPEVDEILAASPSIIDLYLEEPVGIHRSSIIVRNEKQSVMQLGKPRLDPNDNRHMTVDLKEKLPSGLYSVMIAVVALDGHSLKEKYNFEVKTKEDTDEQKFQRLKLDRTFPEDGTIVQASPDKIEVWYSETGELKLLGLLDDKEHSVITESPIADPDDPNHFTIHLKKNLPPGTYSIHSHLKIGDQSKYDIRYFAVQHFTAITGPTYKFGDSLWKHIQLQQLAHWIAYTAVLALFGVYFMGLKILKISGNQRFVINLLYGTAVAAFLLEFIANKMQYSEVVWIDFITFYFVQVLLVQIVLLLISYFIVWNRMKLLLLFLALLGLALTGHTAAPSYGGIWSVALDVIHLFSVSIWIGGLLTLTVMAPKENKTKWLKEKGKLFSKWALTSIVLIAATGILMTIRFVPSFSLNSLISSYWGEMLLAKAILLIVIIVIGIWQRRTLAKWAEGIGAIFRKWLWIELVIAALILLVAGVLVDLSPKDAEEGIYPQTKTVDGVQATVQITPLAASPSEISIRVGDPLDIERVRVKFSTTTGWQVENAAFSFGNGVYKLTGYYFHAPGTMNMEVYAYRADGTVIKLPYIIQIPGVMPPNI